MTHSGHLCGAELDLRKGGVCYSQSTASAGVYCVSLPSACRLDFTSRTNDKEVSFSPSPPTSCGDIWLINAWMESSPFLRVGWAMKRFTCPFRSSSVLFKTSGVSLPRSALIWNWKLWFRARYSSSSGFTSIIGSKADMHSNGARSMAPSVCNLSVASEFTFSINTSNFARVLKWERH